MTILLTGASGLLGANIAHELHRRGHSIRILARAGADLRAIAGLPFEWVKGDISDHIAVQQALEGCEAVIHSAALTGPAPSEYSYYEAVNLQGTIHLAEAALQQGVKRFVYVSTANTIGYGDQTCPGDEWSEFSLFRYNSGYINSKFLAQQYVLEQAAQKRLPAIVVNPSFMIGRYDSKPSSGRIILMGLKSRIQLCPPGGKSFVAVRDVAFGVCQALTEGQTGECYLLTGENMTYKQFFQTLNKVTGHRAIQVVLPWWLILGLAYLLASLARFKIGPEELSPVNARLACLGLYYSPEKAIRELGMPQTPIREAIREAVSWFAVAGMSPLKMRQAGYIQPAM